jgi:hypothetical protein
MEEKRWAEKMNEIVASDRPAIVKLVLSFDEITGRIIADSEQEIQVLRALHDQEALVKEHIKMETLKHARTILQECYQRVTGRIDWHE